MRLNNDDGGPWVEGGVLLYTILSIVEWQTLASLLMQKHQVLTVVARPAHEVSRNLFLVLPILILGD